MRDLKWKTISSEYLFNDRWFRVKKEKCLTPEGKIVDPYYVYEFPTWVGAFALTTEGKVLMVRQYRHALGEVCIEIPGGCIDKEDENPEKAVAREILEETGFEFTSFDYLGKISPNPSTNSNLLHMFLAKGGRKIKEQELDMNEEIDVLEFTVGEIKQMLREHSIVQAMHVTCIMYALEKLGELNY
jgi:ADP-ribose pyrophosphatase